MFNRGEESERKTPLYGQIDERTKAVVYQGDAYAGRFVLFAVLIDVFLRGFRVFDAITSTNLDLMAIVIVGSFISTVYQIKNRVIFNKPYFKSFLFVAVFVAVAAVIAAVLVLVLKDVS